MTQARSRRKAGFTIVELIISTAIALVIAGVVIQVLILTVRSTDQTSTQADVQSKARKALRNWELQLRDGNAVLTQYTPPGVTPTTTYTTRITDSEKTIVAMVPSLAVPDPSKPNEVVPCTFHGINLVFDCIIWRALRGDDKLWTLTRQTFVNAFQMSATYFSYGGMTYTLPASFGRANETTPVTLFSGASNLTVELWNDSTKIAPTFSSTTPAAFSTTAPLPLVLNVEGNRTATAVVVTDVSTVKINDVQFQTTANKLEGAGTVTQSNSLAVSVRLRNKQTW